MFTPDYMSTALVQQRQEILRGEAARERLVREGTRQTRHGMATVRAVALAMAEVLVASAQSVPATRPAL